MSVSEIEHTGTSRPMVRAPEDARSAIFRDGLSGDLSDGFIKTFLGAERARQFIEGAWQQHTCVLSSESTSSLADCWPTAWDIDELFSSVDFPITNLDLANGSEPLSKASYAPGGAIDRGRVLALHRDGATIILRAAHRWSGKLRRLCARLEWDFGFPVQANIYLTPAGRKSTPPHWDTHDLFIVQVAGTKIWRMFASTYQLPLDSQRFSEKTFSVGPLIDEIHLSAGQILYLPRGKIHEPVADSYSIHVSLGVLVSRWADLLLDLVEAASEDREDLRSIIGIPSGQLDSGVEDELTERLLNLIGLLRNPKYCQKAVRRHLESLLLRQVDHRPRELLGAIDHAKAPLSGHMRRKPSAYTWIRSEAGRIEVRWKGGRFSVPAEHESVVKALLTGHAFTLGETLPGGDNDEKIALCKALIEQGLIEALP